MRSLIIIVSAVAFFLLSFLSLTVYADYVLEWQSPSDMVFCQVTCAEAFFYASTIYDIDGDGVSEVPTRHWRPSPELSSFHFLSNLDYSEIWSYTPNPYPGAASYFHGFADIDGDGVKEAFFEYEYPWDDVGGIIAVDTEMDVVEWQLSESYSPDIDIKGIMDIDDDGHDELIIEKTLNDTSYSFQIEIWGSSAPNTSPDSPPVTAPRSYRLSQNYPNPFNPSTKIEYSVQKENLLRIRIYNTLGQLVCTLVDEVRPIGEYSVIWDGKNDNGRSVASGTYFYQLQVGEFVSSKKMVLLK